MWTKFKPKFNKRAYNHNLHAEIIHLHAGKYPIAHIFKTITYNLGQNCLQWMQWWLMM